MCILFVVIQFLFHLIVVHMSGPITKSAADMIMDARRTKLMLTLKVAYEDNHIAQDLVLI